MAELIARIIMAFVRILLPSLLNGEQPTYQEATPQPELQARLRRRIRQTWPAALLMTLLLAPGCRTVDTVYVPHGEPVRIRETVRGVAVWVMGEDGEPMPGVIDIPSGWWALSDDEAAEGE